ncbi:MAG: hypothetical protein NC548_65905 [Lachnospiraceae bacterium]|nr:hypothetical protein [Lachnospiraceae bacterium]MCM1441895.1 hypothetical protein [Roseburia sp.]
MSKDRELIELTLQVLQHYRRLAERSRALEEVQRHLVSMMEYGTVSKILVETEKAMVETMKSEVNDLRKEAEEAEIALRKFKEKNIHI